MMRRYLSLIFGILAAVALAANASAEKTGPVNGPAVTGAARPPRIPWRSAPEAVILFQAKPAASPDPTYALYLARLTLENKAVVKQSVRRGTGSSGLGGEISFGPG